MLKTYTSLGTCRLQGLKNYMESTNLDNAISYTHSTKEHIQLLKFTSGQLDIPAPYNLYCFRTALNDRQGISYLPIFKTKFDATDVFIIEVCSHKLYESKGFYLHHTTMDKRWTTHQHTNAEVQQSTVIRLQTYDELEKDLQLLTELLQPKNFYS